MRSLGILLTLGSIFCAAFAYNTNCPGLSVSGSLVAQFTDSLHRPTPTNFFQLTINNTGPYRYAGDGIYINFNYQATAEIGGAISFPLLEHMTVAANVTYTSSPDFLVVLRTDIPDVYQGPAGILPYSATTNAGFVSIGGGQPFSFSLAGCTIVQTDCVIGYDSRFAYGIEVVSLSPDGNHADLILHIKNFGTTTISAVSLDVTFDTGNGFVIPEASDFKPSFNNFAPGQSLSIAHTFHGISNITASNNKPVANPWQMYFVNLQCAANSSAGASTTGAASSTTGSSSISCSKVAVSQTVANSWNGGSQWTVTLANTGSSVVYAVDVYTAAASSITNLWSMDESSNGHYVFPSYMSGLAAGGTYQFGYTASTSAQVPFSIFSMSCR